jgi:hypothetical protein
MLRFIVIASAAKAAFRSILFSGTEVPRLQSCAVDEMMFHFDQTADPSLRSG